MSRSLSAYPGYADASIAGFDMLPLTWSSLNLRWAAEIYAGGTPSKTNLAFWKDGTIPWLNSGAVNQGTILEVSAFITEAAFASSSAKWIKRGSLVIALAGQGKTKGMVAQLGIDATCNQSMAAIVPLSILGARFLFWWLTSSYQDLRNMAGGDLRDGLNLELLGDVRCPLPAIDEQTQIANFLDHETAKIDALIEKQQQLIALLQEKRQAVISHAVTKGLNPDAPMRDSGVEWLGEVPAHWTVCRIKQVAELESGHTPSRKVEDYWVDCQIPWVSLNDTRQLKVVDFISETAVYISQKGMANSSAHELPAGCVVFTRDASIGLAAITSKVMAVSQHIIAWVCDPAKVSSRYLLLVFYAMEAELERFTFGATLKTIGMSDVKRLIGAFPGVEEQERIVKHIFPLRERIAASIARSEEMLTLLQERRAALISAAVTGKIDVRTWQPPKSQPLPEPAAEVA